MKTYSLEEFFRKEYVNQASYDNLRKIASIMDGLKNSSRKIIYTVLSHNIKDNVKVSQLASQAENSTEYLHGSMAGVLVTLVRNYPGTNNLPLLFGKGNFGTRFSQEASAARYIFARKADYLDQLFNKYDNHIIPEQHFEGTKIEPQFYVPTLPLLLINGSEGVSTGFAQKILSRDVKEIQEYLVKVLNGVKPRKFPLPKFNGFNGVVEDGDTDKQFIIKGVAKKIALNKVLITEVPYMYDLSGYLKVLDNLEANKKIQSYKDLSNDSFKFEVTIPSKDLKEMSDDDILDLLKLTRRVSENYTSMTHENKIKEYESPEEILEDFIAVKREYLQKRKDFVLDDLQKRITLANSRYIFIEAVVNDKLVLSKRKKSDIIKDLDKLNLEKIDDSYDYLLRMPVSSLTEEELKKLKDSVKELNKEYEELSNKTIDQIWLDDIASLKL